MAKFVGLSTSTLLVLLAIQAEPITGFLGLTWAALHLIGTVMYWYGDNA
jgi:uncharacterized membrane protein